MKEIHTEVPGWLEPYLLERGSLKFDDTVYHYVVVKAELGEAHGAPRIFTICNTGVIAVSDAYPEKFRELGLIHEIIEHSKEEKGEYDCVEALKVELHMAEERLFGMEEYVRFRTEFCSNLISFYESKGDLPKEEADLLARLRHSLEHLESLLASS